MNSLFLPFSKYIIIIVFAVYTLLSFGALFPKRQSWIANVLYYLQNIFTLIIIILCNSVLYLTSFDKRYNILMLLEICFLFLTLIIFKRIYTHASRSLTNSMCTLISIGFIIQSRLSFDAAVKQFIVALIALVVSAFIPFLIKKITILNRLGFLYGSIGCILLFLVLMLGKMEYGAKLSLNFGAFTLQPIEFVKISFVLSIAAYLQDGRLLSVIKTVGVAGIQIVLLVICKDLGGALIFTVGLLFMVFVATRSPIYLFLGTGAGVVAAMMAARMFPHVRNRIIAWEDPLSVAESTGYQICQSLFAIASGNWEGRGIYGGIPEKIPVVKKDFVFAAISEEMGAAFAIMLIIVYVCSFLTMFVISMRIREKFYKVIALGLGSMYATQIFLCIGGNIKFIPSTGVTLPLISYGGSSLLSTILIFSIIQGIYELFHEEVREREIKQKERFTEKNTNIDFDMSIDAVSKERDINDDVFAEMVEREFEIELEEELPRINIDEDFLLGINPVNTKDN